MEKTDINTGLTEEQARQRKDAGLSNGSLDVKTKSVGRIFRDNILTLFNIVNFVLAGLVALVGSFRNMLFMGVIISNIAIGIFQEIRSKRVIDRLSLISAPKAHVLRDGAEKTLPVSEIVKDDIMLLSMGRQVCADGVVLSGECEVDESLVTGESDPVLKREGDELLSGSFITSGEVKAQAVRVGAESYSGKITGGAKYIKKRSSEMMKAINKIIKAVSVCIFPFGAVLFAKAFFVAHQEIESGVTSTVAALIGMIPEGLVLLTGIALAVSTIRLAQKQTLCQDLYCVESLARVDVLCLDKTGTITEGSMDVSEVIILDDDFDADKALCAFSAAFSDPNPTLKAVKDRFSGDTDLTLCGTVPFSSAKKWSSAEFEGFGTVVFGAPDFILSESELVPVSDKIKEYALKGMRVLLLAHSENPTKEKELPEGITPKALVILSDKIRVSAPDTLAYFKKQGVTLKVISGDDPVTVSNVAKRAGLSGAESYVDASVLSDEEVAVAAEKYTIFGRVTPYRKLELIKALRAGGHKVAMTGDGVNDVLALKEADCSVAMQSGSDAARCVSQLVLLNSDFASMPLVVEEGRRCINNIQRSASLFLVKTVFSFLLAVLFLFLPFAYPFKPIQMTLISAITIGIPSFLLALEPNHDIVRGGFLANVLRRAAPGGITIAFGVGMIMAARGIFGIDEEHASVMTVFLTAFVSFSVLFRVCMPFNKMRAVMYAGLLLLFVGAAFVLHELFYLIPLDNTEIIVLLVLAAAALLCFVGLNLFCEKVFEPQHKWHKK